MMLSRVLVRDIERVLGEQIRSDERDPYGACAAHFLGIGMNQVTREQREWIKERVYDILGSDGAGEQLVEAID